MFGDVVDDDNDELVDIGIVAVTDIGASVVDVDKGIGLCETKHQKKKSKIKKKS